MSILHVSNRRPSLCLFALIPNDPTTQHYAFFTLYGKPALKDQMNLGTAKFVEVF